MAELAFAVLDEWTWLDDPSAPPPAGDANAVLLPADPTVCDVPARVGARGAPAAELCVPGPNLAPARQADARTWTEVFVPLTAAAELTVTSSFESLDARTRATPRRPGIGELPVVTDASYEQPTAAGPVHRIRAVHGTEHVRHEAHLDRDGWAWTLVLEHGPDEEHLAGVLDEVLATWRWLG